MGAGLVQLVIVAQNRIRRLGYLPPKIFKMLDIYILEIFIFQNLQVQLLTNNCLYEIIEF